MLLLTASKNEDVVVKLEGREILRFRLFRLNGKWRIGISAPEDVKILRETRNGEECRHERSDS